ncbi:MAG: phosphatase PAP2 family protein [Phycisphaerae bacterium]|nr:phosphatase PAP2 family protein [Gemmatimonadaceae bacterium]
MSAPEMHPSRLQPAERSSRSRWLVAATLSLLVIVLAHLADPWAWANLQDARVYERDWGRLLRILGFLPTWIVVGLALWAHDRGSTGWRWRGGLMVLVPAAAGGAAEILKLVFRRLRPGETSPDYVFRPFMEDMWSNRGMGLPSSHVMVAMGAAVALAQLFPRTRWLWYAMAAGCGYTRVLARAHYVSDVVVAGFVAWFVGDAIMRWGLNKRAR